MTKFQSAKEEKEATSEISGAVVQRLSRLPYTQKVSSAILDSIKKSSFMELINRNCTKSLFNAKYGKANSRKIA